MKISATFSNGHSISRETSKEYAFAYMMSVPACEYMETGARRCGFAATKELAEKAARNEIPRNPRAIDKAGKYKGHNAKLAALAVIEVVPVIVE